MGPATAPLWDFYAEQQVTTCKSVHGCCRVCGKKGAFEMAWRRVNEPKAVSKILTCDDREALRNAWKEGSPVLA